MNGTTNQLLAGPCLADDERRRIRRRHELHLLQGVFQARAVSDYFLEIVLGLNLVRDDELGSFVLGQVTYYGDYARASLYVDGRS